MAHRFRRPEVFISAASADLKSVRDEVKAVVDRIQCHGVTQETFPQSYEEVTEMLRGIMENCDAVIHIAGVCYGSEPQGLPLGGGRRSYTQLEREMALGFSRPVPVFVYVCGTAFDYDPHEPEPEDKKMLQMSYREMLMSAPTKWESPSCRAGLLQLVAENPTALIQMRETAARLAEELEALKAVIQKLSRNAADETITRGKALPEFSTQDLLVEVARRLAKSPVDLEGAITGGCRRALPCHAATAQLLAGRIQDARLSWKLALKENVAALNAPGPDDEMQAFRKSVAKDILGDFEAGIYALLLNRSFDQISVMLRETSAALSAPDFESEQRSLDTWNDDIEHIRLLHEGG